MTDKDKIRNIIELFIAWNGETDVIDIANIDSAVDFINDSLQVKDTDLEKEIISQIRLLNGVHTLYNNKQWWKGTYNELSYFAKHFFSLGIAVSNPITAADRGTAEEIIINLKRVEQDYHIDLTREMEWLRNKVQKGE